MVQRTDIEGGEALIGPALTIPNLITFARLLAVPVAVWLILDGDDAAAFWVFIAAGVSDAADGYIAKHFDSRSRLGALLDPLADKALLTSVYVALAVAGQLPGWLVSLVVLRDSLILAGFVRIQATGAPYRFDPLLISKLNTLLQIALVGFVLGDLGLDIHTGIVIPLLTAAVAVTTIVSGFWYLGRWARVLVSPHTARPDPRL
ncbi:MAG TPA: CDP-alcohol phosphatidyltransferase family protein [Stellaceae bacterium]|jgi:cardiolipin synthase|nr:CDP-alcohol phosphatidyltransferase family protein [Stellaceae bacterium]